MAWLSARRWKIWRCTMRIWLGRFRRHWCCRPGSTPLRCWLPLLILSAWQGQLLDGSAVIPFLKDLEVHIRFLVAVPLLIGAEIVVHDRMRFLVAQFIERDLIAEEDLHRFQAAITSAMRLRSGPSSSRSAGPMGTT